tara:strand:- start:323 stop:1285 length:963 start_codon:yes stop_codon:yes gene_type:complete
VATVDLGKISFVNKGTYDASTTYEERDVVQFTDGALSSYVYINATPASGQTPSTGGSVNSSHWNVFAGGVSLAVGNNKIVITDGSGSVSSVAIGSAGTALKVNSSANGFEFGETGGGLQSIQTFTSSGTYTKPSGINKVKVIVTAGGGGGGGGSSNYNGGSGGGAGGTAIELIDVSSLSSTVAVTVGGGGNGVGSNGTGGTGGTSSFGSYCSATGGNGGGGADQATIADGGSATGGDLNILGGDGHTGGGGGSVDDTSGGDGGISFWGGGGSKTKVNNNRANARAGQAYGSGGGGGNHIDGSNYQGGNGSDGVVYIEEYK